ncbi:MAG TPA: protein-export chaperone SecB [Pseudomonadales bacterium]
MTEQAQPQFALQRIYVKDLSFESPLGVSLFQMKLAPQVKMDMNTRHSKIEEGVYEVVLSVNVTATQDDKTAFVVEVQQAGLFGCNNIPEPQLDQVLRAFCPNILFPYLREAVDSLVVRGGLPALQLSPVNFDALYQQARAQQDAKGKEAQH